MRPPIFDPAQALAHAARFARPRRVGSGTDRQVADDLAAYLEHLGYEVRRQPFHIHQIYRILVAAQLLAGQALIGLMLVAWDAAFWIRLGLSALLIGLLAVTGRLHRFARAASVAERATSTHPAPELGRRLGGALETENVLAEPAGQHCRPERPCLVLMAHYDSKSQRVALPARMGLYALASAAAVTAAVLYLLRVPAPWAREAATAAGALAVVAAAALVLLQDVGNASPGAVDNASGLGLVLHLGEWLNLRRDLRERLCVRILLTGAEEFGALGAVAYVHANVAALRAQQHGGGLCVLNFDGIGARGQLCFAGGRLGTGSPLAEAVRGACADRKISLTRVTAFGAVFDHVPFVEHGFDALTLMAIGPSARWVHTRGDTADKLAVEGFGQAGAVALAVIEALAASAAGEQAAS